MLHVKISKNSCVIFEFLTLPKLLRPLHNHALGVCPAKVKKLILKHIPTPEPIEKLREGIWIRILHRPTFKFMIHFA